ncbi:MAG: hypothetical protein ACREUU_01775 [Gammaproteobacteria bacterium]
MNTDKHRWSKMACVLAIALFMLLPAFAHHAPDPRVSPKAKAQAAPGGKRDAAGISGQGKLRFRVLYTSERLPPQAKEAALNAAHGGFAVDRRPGKGETYFALPGAGILQISADLKTIRVLETPENIKKVNLHNTTLWQAADGTPYLVFPANGAGKIFTTTLEGKLVHTLDAPTGDEQFEPAEINNYFIGKGHFAPTDVAYLDGLYYVATGYSPLDYVLTARVSPGGPVRVVWSDLAFGGKGDAPNQFQTGHGITVPPMKKRLDVADRPRSEIRRFTRYGHYLSSLKMPRGSLPCDIDYLDRYAVVAALDGPDRSKGAPIYLLEDDQLVSTIMPKEDLGLEKFAHNHNAVLRKIGNKLYIIVQAWNPGDFAILEQVD